VGFPDFDLQLFSGSGAGLNYVNAQALYVGATTGGAYDSGIVGAEGAFFSKTSLQIVANTAAITGWSVVCYGTHDIRALYQANKFPVEFAPKNFTFPTTSWVPIAAPSSEDASPDSYAWANPLTALGVSLFSPEPWVALRVVATADSATGDIAVIYTRVP
jgi:hypothetical protein